MVSESSASASGDVTVIRDGFHGDTSRMYYVGEPSIAARRLCEVTYDCMWLGIEQVRPGATIGDTPEPSIDAAEPGAIATANAGIRANRDSTRRFAEGAESGSFAIRVTPPAGSEHAPIAPRGDVRLLLSANGLAMLLLGILPEPLMALCLYSIQVSL